MGMTNLWVSVAGRLGVGVWVGHIIPIMGEAGNDGYLFINYVM